MPDVRHRLPRAVAAELLVQLAARHVRRVQRPRRAARRRSRSRRPRSDALDPRGRGRGVGRRRSRRTRAGPSNIVKALAKAFKIDLDKPWNKLGEKQRDVLLHGTGDKRVTVAWEGRHSTGEWAMRFEGILAQLERRHRESSSERTQRALRAVLPRDPVRGVPRHAPAARVARGVRQRASRSSTSPA